MALPLTWNSPEHIGVYEDELLCVHNMDSSDTLTRLVKPGVTNGAGMSHTDFTAAVMILALVSPQLLGQATDRGPVKTTLCNLIRTPETFDGKKVQIRGVVRSGFETTTISDDSCDAFIWLSWRRGTGDSERDVEIAYIDSPSQLASPKKLYWRPFLDRKPISVIQNEALRKLDYYLGQFYGPKGFSGLCHDRPVNCPAFTVEATITGRFDHRELRPCAVRLRSHPEEVGLSKGGCGFGHLNSYDSQLAVEVVSDVVAYRIDPATYRKTQALAPQQRAGSGRPPADQER